MRNNLTKAAERVAIIYMLEQEHRLTRPPIRKTGSDPSSQERVLEELNKIPKLPQLTTEDFRSLLQLIQTHYDKVFSLSMTALENIYRYEIVRLHQALQEFVKRLFRELHKRGDDAQIQYKVLESEAKDELLRAKALEEKLQALPK